MERGMRGKKADTFDTKYCLGLRCQIWNLFEGQSLFSGQDPEFQTYRSRAHLAEMIRLLGPPSPSFLARGNLTQKFFSQEGNSSIYPFHVYKSVNY